MRRSCLAGAVLVAGGLVIGAAAPCAAGLSALGERVATAWDDDYGTRRAYDRLRQAQAEWDRLMQRRRELPGKVRELRARAAWAQGRLPGVEAQLQQARQQLAAAQQQARAAWEREQAAKKAVKEADARVEQVEAEAWAAFAATPTYQRARQVDRAARQRAAASRQDIRRALSTHPEYRAAAETMNAARRELEELRYDHSENSPTVGAARQRLAEAYRHMNEMSGREFKTNALAIESERAAYAAHLGLVGLGRHFAERVLPQDLQYQMATTALATAARNHKAAEATLAGAVNQYNAAAGRTGALQGEQATLASAVRDGANADVWLETELAAIDAEQRRVEVEIQGLQDEISRARHSRHGNPRC
jgi:chromosome segregation ATPase